MQANARAAKTKRRGLPRLAIEDALCSKDFIEDDLKKKGLSSYHKTRETPIVRTAYRLSKPSVYALSRRAADQSRVIVNRTL